MNAKEITMRKVHLETERLILRTVTASYAGKILKFYDDNRDFLEQYEPLRQTHFYTKQHQKQILKWDVHGLHRSTMVRVWLFKKDDPSHTIGTVSLSNISRGVFQSCFLGYKIDHNHAEQGYMTEALLKMIDYAFTTLDLHRIEANIMPRNIPSLNLVRKLGFKEEGLAKKYLKINGKWEDHFHMVLLKDDKPE